MRNSRLVLAISATCLIAAATAGGTGAAAQGSTGAAAAAQQRLAAIQQELMRAWIDRERTKLEALLAPDWFVTGPNEVITSRSAVLSDVFDRGVHRILSGAITDVDVRLIGNDAAVVTGLTNAAGTYEGTPYSAEIRFTDVFERHAGAWRAVRSHASSVTR